MTPKHVELSAADPLQTSTHTRTLYPPLRRKASIRRRPRSLLARPAIILCGVVLVLNVLQLLAHRSSQQNRGLTTTRSSYLRAVDHDALPFSSKMARHDKP